MENTKTIVLMSVNADVSALSKLYNIMPADSKESALGLVSKNSDDISAILIDVGAALENDGELINALKKKGIPIIVILQPDTTDDDKAKCIDMGASDFICPGAKAGIMKKRIDNLIQLYELSETHKRVAKDGLTEAYTKHFFMEYMSQMIMKNPDKTFDLVCLELESYELLHGRYGVEICNIFMSTMVKSLGEMLPPGSLMGRIDDAHVVFLFPHIPFEFHVEMMQGCIRMSEGSPFPFFVINAGVCETELNMSVEETYQNCLMAIDKIRYNPEHYIAQYDDSIREKKSRLKMLEQNMYKALAERHFQVYYQPKYNTKGDIMHGAEALVRWIDPELGFMSPGDFIPLFEKNGFIFELDKYILEAVCMDIRKWIDSGMNVVPVSVNVSQTDFDQTSLDSIFEQIVDKYNIPHEYIHFEITETSDAPDAIKKSIAVSEFRNKGFHVELDDFGTGFSTLSILKSMPVDVMKIDMSLVRNMFDANCRAILEGALFTAMKMNIRVVIEGVENDEQYNELKNMCEGRIEPDIQGYYFSKPLPSDAFREKLSSMQ